MDSLSWFPALSCNTETVSLGCYEGQGEALGKGASCTPYLPSCVCPRVLGTLFPPFSEVSWPHQDRRWQGRASLFCFLRPCTHPIRQPIGPEEHTLPAPGLHAAGPLALHLRPPEPCFHALYEVTEARASLNTPHST